MTRDEQEANRENMTGLETARAQVRDRRAFTSLGQGAPAYVSDVQAAVDRAVSAATRNLRQWDRRTLYAAYKAARPIVEQDLRQQGRAFTRDEVKAAVRPRVAAYVARYGVVLPAGTRVGATALEAVAGDVCGAFSMPWTAFMPPQVQIAAKAAQAGSPKAQGWLKKLFGRGAASAPPLAPAPVAVAAPTVAAPAPAVAAAAKAEKPASDEAGGTSAPDKFAGWGIGLYAQYPSGYRQGRRSDRGYGGRGSRDSGRDEGRGRRRHHRHHRRDQGQGQGQQPYNPSLPISATNQPYGQPYNPNLPISASNQPYGQTPTYNPSLPIGPYNQPPGQPYNPSLPASAISDYQTAYAREHGASSPTAYNPYLPAAVYNPNLPVSPTNVPPYGTTYAQQPYGTAYNPNLPASPTNVPPTLQPAPDDYTIYGSDSLGAFMQKLNPLYWFKSAEQRKLIDAERQAWIDNAKLQKQVGKKEEVVEQGKKALEAKQAVAAAQARAAELETQLKAIETQVLGACGKADILGTIGPAEIVGSATLGSIGPAEILGADRKQNPFNEKDDPYTDTILSPKDAAPVLGKIKKARQLNADNEADLAPICAKLQNNKPLSPDESAKVLILLARNEQLHEFRKGLVSGELYAKNPSAKTIRRNVMMGAVAAMTPTEQLMLAQMTALAKQGNPNAIKALASLKAQGYAVTMGATPVPVAQIPGKLMTPAEQAKLATIVTLARQGNPNALRALTALREQGYAVTMGKVVCGSATRGSSMGWGISDAFSLALKPITVSTKYLWKGTKKVGRALGITHADANPEQVRMSRVRAAVNRQKAAQARARAADAQSEAEYRTQQAFAAAADAEADAADAEATAKEAAMQTAEAEFMPGQTDADAEDSSGRTAIGRTAIGRTAPVITQLPDTPVPPTPTAVKLKAQRRALVAKKNPLAAKILAKSEEQSPAGMKLAASMAFYKKAEKRKSKERKAAAMMVAKAKKGDKQAMADVQALKAAGIAVKAERSAGRRVAAVYAYRATTAKVVAARKKAEIAVSDKLIRRSRAKQLAKVAKIERGAAAGNKPCQLFVKKHVAKAKAGDKGSKKVVAALLLAKNARTVAPNKREQKKLRAAGKMVRRIGKGDRKAIRDSRVIVAAAKHGNPNAKAARKKLQTAAAYEQTLRTGMIVLPAVVVTSEIALKRQKAKKAADQKRLASVEAKIAKGTASREEAQAAAKAASDEGDKARATELMATAATLPSAGEELKRVATVAAAATAGNPKYQASVENASRLAAAGDPAGIEAMGKLAGVKALSDVSNGKPIDPAMKTAVQDIERAQDGDPVAAEKLATMQAQAAEKVPAAIKYMVAATGAAVVARALSNNPVAQEQWKEKAGVKPRTDTENDPVVVDAEVVTAGMSSLPDAPLPPVVGIVGLFKAVLSAVALATKDPFQNYREGVASRARRLGPQALGPVSSTGWGGNISSLLTRAKAGDQKALETIHTMQPFLPDPKTPEGKKAWEERRIKDLMDMSLNPRNLRIWSNAHKTKQITLGDYKLLQDLEFPPGQTLNLLKGYKIALVDGPPSMPEGLSGDDKKQEVAKKKDPEAQYMVHAKPQEDPEKYMVHGDGQKSVFSYDQPDELFWPGRLTRERLANIKARSQRGDKLAQQALIEIRMKNTPESLDKLKGDVPSDLTNKPSQNINTVQATTAARDRLVSDTKTRLQALVNAATAGDKKAQAKWDTARANYTKAKTRAAKGDAKAKDMVSVLEATGLFVQ